MSLAQNYSFTDKLLHRLAFSTPFVQRILTDLENAIYKSKLSNIHSEKEVFITGLPRSGTTLLLELMYETGQFSTFTYRHMPFVESPLLWASLVGRFSKEGEKIERAHGDGMEVTYDSPEAFEEVLWLSHLKKVFVKEDKIEPLTRGTTSQNFAAGFKLLIKKLLLSASDNSRNRYLSKNNNNCCRLDVIKAIFPSSIILVPFREPFAHIGSLLKQHLQFSELHQDDDFSRDYMRWIGHYDFGLNFKPINFNGWLGNRNDYQSEAFWLEYWCVAYEYVLENLQENVFLVDFDKLLSYPEEVLTEIAAKAQLENTDSLINQSQKMRAPTSKPSNLTDVNKQLSQRSMNLYEALKEKAI